MSTGVIIGEAVSVLIVALLQWARAKGLSDEECNRLADELAAKIKASKPEDLPDV
jgi:hypothetical protein